MCVHEHTRAYNYEGECGTTRARSPSPYSNENKTRTRPRACGHVLVSTFIMQPDFSRFNNAGWRYVRAAFPGSVISSTANAAIGSIMFDVAKDVSTKAAELARLSGRKTVDARAIDAAVVQYFSSADITSSL